MSAPLLLLAWLMQPWQALVIGGRVVGAVTNEPLSRVTFAMAATSERASWITTRSSSSGTFRFEGLAAGKYTLTGAHLRYVKQAFGQRALNSACATAIVAGPTEETDELIFRMIPSAVIAGTVHDEFGEGLAGMDVLACRITGFGNQERLHLMGSDVPLLRRPSA